MILMLGNISLGLAEGKKRSTIGYNCLCLVVNHSKFAPILRDIGAKTIVLLEYPVASLPPYCFHSGFVRLLPLFLKHMPVCKLHSVVLSLDYIYIGNR